MAYCDQCGNFDKSHAEYTDETTESQDYQPDLYYYWDGDFCVEDYDWRGHFPKVDCMCEICFDIANKEKKIKWECASI